MTAEPWRATARDLAHQRRAIWIWSPIFTCVGLLAVAGGVMAEQWWVRWPGLVCGGLLASWGLVYGTAVYMRTVDEQERDANLWSCYIGMCAYLVLYLAQSGAAAIGRPIPHAADGTFLIVMAVVLGVFAWKRFR